MLADPVAARFDRKVPLIAPLVSADSTAVALPPRTPAVACRRRLPLTPCETPHRNDVSDPHAVRSHDETLTLKADVKAADPKLPPCKVTLAEPVVATFVRRAILAHTDSNEKPWLLLPTRSEVTEIWRLPNTPSPAWHRVELSDSHTVRSHAVSPNRDPAVYVARPMLPP